MDTIESCKDKYKIKVRLIPSIDRSHSIESAKESLNVILQLKEIYGSLIVGIDLSGDPKINNFNMFSDVFTKARESGLKLAFHCGEEPNREDEINDTINFGVDRIGHGTFINDEALIVIKEKGIPIECCLTSNIKCQTVNSYEKHHFKKLYDRDHPVILCVIFFFLLLLFRTSIKLKFSFSLLD